jgi:hypothetical protein
MVWSIMATIIALYPVYLLVALVWVVCVAAKKWYNGEDY